MKAKKGSKATKTRVSCFECGNAYRLDLSKIPADKRSIDCPSCSAQIPLVTRMAEDKAGANEPQELVAVEAPEEKREATQATPSFYGAMAATTGPGAWGDEEGGDDSAWLAVYGDIMSLLLLFFVLLYAMSSIDKHKFEIAINAISQGLGGSVVYVPSPEAPSEQPSAGAPLSQIRQAIEHEKDSLDELYMRLYRFIVESGLQDKFLLLDESEGLVLIAQDMTMFDLGKADLQAGVLPYLKKIGDILSQIENPIVVEGHTDDIPIRGGVFSSNWELSVRRATNVVHFLIEECHLDPTFLAAAGYAYFKPRYDLHGEEAGRNRRIEVLIKRRYPSEIADQILRAESQ